MNFAARLPISIRPPTIERQLQRAFLQLFPEALVEPAGTDPQAAIDRDSELLDALLAARRPGRCLRLWSNPACIVLPANRLDENSRAIATAAAERLGAGLALRRSGGSAVVHRPGILCISLIEVAVSAACGTLYAPLLELVAAALGRLGLVSDYGPVAGSYCDGSYNVRIGGRKLAGTAALIRRRDGLQARLGHAMLTIWGDPTADVAAVAAIERAIGLGGAYTADVHTSLCAELQRRGFAARANSVGRRSCP